MAIKTSPIQQPLDYSILDTGVHEIFGIAWTGQGTIYEVEISLNGGNSWGQTTLQHNIKEPYSWVFWTYTWNAVNPGEYLIKVRAKDTTGRIQPPVAEWNRKGYGYNAETTLNLKVE
ncbi:hypothetical protein [Clostridium formicaceticum]|jgi:hypothetical protein|uniref:Mo-co oxidoreductase dimerization domain protein n=1 Tax=Clostridium formicaceticum TaxID=1497 RepID=A0AAC9WI41_9CLOT|nr:hypothetical protein [Clostridium formicaceticum]AOY75300.1 hypothetical protein BJL90_04905 [Clostridium formicaceticum]ARE89742.1 Mo-co oxidoreductase dimerization domain protein [Clostridium formicaceticum]